MSLRRKMVLSVGGLCLAALVVFTVVGWTLARGAFLQVDRQYALTSLLQIRSAIADELRALRATGGDWAAWDDTWTFVQDGNPAYIAANLTTAALANLRLDFMVFLGPDKRVVNATFVNRATGEAGRVSDVLVQYLTVHPTLLQHADARDARQGLVLVPEGPALVAVWPVSRTAFAGPVKGALVLGRYLTDAELARIARQVQLRAVLCRLDASALPEDFGEARRRMGPDRSLIRTATHDRLVAYAELPDLDRRPALMIRVDSPRDVTVQGMQVVRLYLVLAALLTVTVLLVLYALLQRGIVERVARLAEHAARIGRSGDLLTRLNPTETDEIGALGREFDRMVERLADGRWRLLKQSYDSGKAGATSSTTRLIATSLAPVATRVRGLAQRLGQAVPASVDRALAELRSDSLSADRRDALCQHVELTINYCRRLGREGQADLEVLETHLNDLENPPHTKTDVPTDRRT